MIYLDPYSLKISQMGGTRSNHMLDKSNYSLNIKNNIAKFVRSILAPKDDAAQSSYIHEKETEKVIMKKRVIF